MKNLISILFFFLLFSYTIFPQWYQQNSGTTNTLRDVWFTELYNGIVVGDFGTICTTTDGGMTWIFETIGTNYSLSSICFADANNGWIAGYNIATYSGIILKTTNGGTNWTEQSLGTNIDLQAIDFADSVSLNILHPFYAGNL